MRRDKTPTVRVMVHGIGLCKISKPMAEDMIAAGEAMPLTRTQAIWAMLGLLECNCYDCDITRHNGY